MRKEERTGQRRAAHRINPSISQALAFTLIRICMLIVLSFVGVLVYYIFINGIGNLSIEFLTSPPKHRMTEGGIFPAIMGTVLLIVMTMAVALPLGVLSAIYLNEYASESRRVWVINMAINNLAGTPSIVFGLFGLAVFVKYAGFGPSLIAASLTLVLVVVPVIIRASEEALMSVPAGLREGSLALGATKWQTVQKVVIPAAMPSIITGAILSIGRVAGETAPILLTGAAYFIPRLPDSVFDQFMALPYHLFILSTAGTDIEQTRGIQYSTALVLLLIVLAINIIAVIIRSRYRKKLMW